MRVMHGSRFPSDCYGNVATVTNVNTDSVDMLNSIVWSLKHQGIVILLNSSPNPHVYERVPGTCYQDSRLKLVEALELF